MTLASAKKSSGKDAHATQTPALPRKDRRRHVLGLAFSPVGSLLATCGEDGTVRLWDRHAAPHGVQTIGPGPFGGGVRAVVFTADGRFLATANANGTVYLLRVGPPSP